MVEREPREGRNRALLVLNGIERVVNEKGGSESHTAAIPPDRLWTGGDKIDHGARARLAPDAGGCYANNARRAINSTLPPDPHTPQYSQLDVTQAMDKELSNNLEVRSARTRGFHC